MSFEAEEAVSDRRGSVKQRGRAVVWFLRQTQGPSAGSFSRGVGHSTAPVGGTEDLDTSRDKVKDAKQKRCVSLHGRLATEGLSTGFRRGSQMPADALPSDEPSHTLARPLSANRDPTQFTPRSGGLRSVSISGGRDGGRVGRSVPTRPASAASANKTEIASSKGGPQSRFLHQALVAIGREVDEKQRQAELGEVTWHPASVATEHRHHMREDYARHTKSVYEELRERVLKREASIDRLKAKVGELEKRLATTRAILERRSMARKGQRAKQAVGMSPANPVDNGSVRGSVCATVVSTNGAETMVGASPTSLEIGVGVIAVEADIGSKMTVDVPERVKRSSVGSLGIADSEEKARHELSDEAEAVLHMLDVHAVVEEKLQAELAAQTQLFVSQTIERKAAETSLLISHAEVMRLRTEACRAENHVKCLTRELKQLFRRMPEIIENQVGKKEEAKLQLTEKSTEIMQKDNAMQLAKFSDDSTVQSQTEVVKATIVGLCETEALAKQTLKVGTKASRNAKESLEHHMLNLKAFENAWGTLAIQWTELLRADRDVVLAKSKELTDCIAQSMAVANTLQDLLEKIDMPSESDAEVNDDCPEMDVQPSSRSSPIPGRSEITPTPPPLGRCSPMWTRAPANCATPEGFNAFESVSEEKRTWFHSPRSEVTPTPPLLGRLAPSRARTPLARSLTPNLQHQADRAWFETDSNMPRRSLCLPPSAEVSMVPPPFARFSQAQAQTPPPKPPWSKNQPRMLAPRQ
eukprot:TRINITY_DN54697_c0_g1_i1.p1 TRINITY_DN54697_c0_g1~~TRINITY_DN54697_c0_g1_i1.p1  ORF type:complete len:753 (+),score=128.41 TRINITY_DN54697_c0_g1_i1:284-2542(+)